MTRKQYILIAVFLGLLAGAAAWWKQRRVEPPEDLSCAVFDGSFEAKEVFGALHNSLWWETADRPKLTKEQRKRLEQEVKELTRLIEEIERRMEQQLREREKKNELH